MDHQVCYKTAMQAEQPYVGETLVDHNSPGVKCGICDPSPTDATPNILQCTLNVSVQMTVCFFLPCLSHGAGYKSMLITETMTHKVPCHPSTQALIFLSYFLPG